MSDWKKLCQLDEIPPLGSRVVASASGDRAIFRTADDEVLEYAGAFLQLYREEGFYLERTCHYIARVGLDYVKKIVLDDEARRKELYERLLFALQNYEDPWSAAVQKPAVRREFEILEV